MALEAIRKRGAFWFFSKPIDMVMLELQVEMAFEHAEAMRRGRLAAERLAALQPATDSLGESPAMKEIERLIDVVARSRDTTVLLLGESGTGKGVVAEQIHRRSGRRDQVFQEINCAGLSETFLETELFGAERGAYTDAKTLKRGLLEIADGGTVFLDEIGDLALALQPKLLKVLEARRFRRLGGVKDIEVDVRLIAATHQDLDAQREEGRKREDLFYRLNVMPIRLPPLRERGQDALLLGRRFLEHFSRALGRPGLRLLPESESVLARHRWPGNVRELKNVIERAVILCPGDEIGPEHLPAEIQQPRGDGEAAPLELGGAEVRPLAEVERAYIAHALALLEGNRSRTAQALGISRSTLIEKVKKYDLA
jgi:DNA-binding NtrC family response regulator